jgi:DNA-binding XRE family transcriptional regulator
LAEAVGVDVQTIGYLEGGDYKPSLELALKIARHFGVAVEMLFSLERFESIAMTFKRARAAFLSARNDTVANVAIIATGFMTAYTYSAWPDLIVGLGIAAMNAGAAREVWSAAREEYQAAHADRISN